MAHRMNLVVQVLLNLPMVVKLEDLLQSLVKIYQVDLYMMYLDPSTNYQHDHFEVFSDVVENSSTTITKDWVIDLNNGMETLVFLYG
jgi:hypothetical protein